MKKSNNKTIVNSVPGRHDVEIIREFDAPRELVFRAYTDPKLVGRWLGPHGYKMTIEKFDMKPGGSYRYLHEDPEGNRFSFRGVVHEVDAPRLLIQTFEFEGMPEKGHVSLDTARFEELPGGRSRVVGISVFQTVEDRDGMIAAGMERGVREGYEQLDQLLEEMKRT